MRIYFKDPLSADTAFMARVIRENIDAAEGEYPESFHIVASSFELYGIPTAYKVKIVDDGSGRKLGFIGYEVIPKTALVVPVLFVPLKFQHRGIGAGTLRWIESVASAKDYPLILFPVPSESKGLRSFLAALGYGIVAATPEEQLAYRKGIFKRWYIRGGQFFGKEIPCRDAAAMEPRIDPMSPDADGV